MRTRTVIRWVLFALIVLAIPASSFAQVRISVAIAPPLLPVYEQPRLPRRRLYLDARLLGLATAMITTGYQAPGCWLRKLASSGRQAIGDGAGAPLSFKEGYWGPHVGFYGGINYGFG